MRMCIVMHLELCPSVTHSAQHWHTAHSTGTRGATHITLRLMKIKNEESMGTEPSLPPRS